MVRRKAGGFLLKDVMKEKELNFRTSRALMVDCQVRPNNIVDDRIIIAMRTLARERFVPPSLAAQAYSDADLPLADGRMMPRPLTIGRLAQSAAVQPGERVLVIGANTGYGAAVLSSCGGVVVALESSPSLRAIASSALAAETPDVRLIGGALIQGAPQHTRFDLIVIEGAIEYLPPALAGQLNETGRLITVMRERGVGRLIRAEPSGAGFAHRVLADCNAPLLAEFAAAPAFAF